MRASTSTTRSCPSSLLLRSPFIPACPAATHPRFPANRTHMCLPRGPSPRLPDYGPRRAALVLGPPSHLHARTSLPPSRAETRSFRPSRRGYAVQIRCARRMPTRCPRCETTTTRAALYRIGPSRSYRARVQMRTSQSHTHTGQHGGPRLVHLAFDVSKTTPPVDRNCYRPPAAAAVRAERIASVARSILARLDATAPAQMRPPSTLWKRGRKGPQVRAERTPQRR